jgi:hypothetical protein
LDLARDLDMDLDCGVLPELDEVWNLPIAVWEGHCEWHLAGMVWIVFVGGFGQVVTE